MKYQFVNNMGAHAFRIHSEANGATGTQYNDGITNNDVSNGTLEWNVQFDAPNTLYYQCTAHPSMGGVINIGGGGGGSSDVRDTWLFN
jgi:plastocyanin